MTIEFGGHALFRNPHELRERDQAIVGGAHVQHQQVLRAAYRPGCGFEHDRHRTVLYRQFGHFVAVDQRPQHGTDRVHRYAEIGGALPVQFQRQLRLRCLVFDADVAHLRQFAFHFQREGVRRLGNHVMADAGQCKADAAIGAAYAEAVAAGDAYLCAGNVAQRTTQAARQLGLADIAFAPVLQAGDHGAEVRIAAASDGKHILHRSFRGKRRKCLFHLFDLAIHVRNADAIGPGQCDAHHAAIFCRHQFAVDAREEQYRRADQQQANADDPPWHGQKTIQHACVMHVDVCADCDQTRLHPPRLAIGRQTRGNRRYQRQRDKGRDHYRNRHHIAELDKQPPRFGRQERNWQEHRRQRGGGGDDGEEHFARAEYGGSQIAEAFGAAPLNVFDDDNRVVHHQAAGHHQCQ